MRWDQNEILRKNAEEINSNEWHCRNERARVLMYLEIGEEQGMSNNKIYLKLNGFHGEKNMFIYNNIDKPRWNIINIDKNKLKSRNLFWE